MTWTKLSDDFSDDCWTLSDAAFRLHTEALIWSNRKLLDLVIPKSDLVRFARRPDQADALVAVGWWTETDKTYVIRHHASYQRSREQVLHQQEVNKQNAAKGGRPPKAAREVFNPDKETDSLTDSLTDSETERDRTGQAGLDRGSSSEEQIDWVTGEVTDSPNGVCPHPLTTALQRQRGMCNSCWVTADAQRKTAKS